MRRRPARPTGFTLVEVLVALFIMSVLAAMAWQGIDALVRARDGARASNERVLQLGTVLAQWEQDLAQLQDSAAAPALRFDGASLRLTRRDPAGLRFVVWTLQDHRLWRWASPPVTRVQDLQEGWMRALQWSAIGGEALAMLDDVSQWQVYYWQGSDNNWSNAQSSGDLESGEPAAAPPPEPPGSGPAGDTPGAGSGRQAVPQFEREALPKGVRLQLGLPQGLLTRDVLLQP